MVPEKSAAKNICVQVFGRDRRGRRSFSRFGWLRRFCRLSHRATRDQFDFDFVLPDGRWLARQFQISDRNRVQADRYDGRCNESSAEVKPDFQIEPFDDSGRKKTELG